MVVFIITKGEPSEPIKMLGPALFATLLLMDVIGASSASAESTLLCSTDPATSCTAVSHVHETSVGKAKLLSSPTVECNVLFLGEVLELGGPQVIHGTFTYSSCNNSCTVVEENGPALIEVLKEGSELASYFETLSLKVKCLFFLTCVYSVELEGHALGPLTSSELNGSVVIELRAFLPVIGTCPEETLLDLTTTSLSHTYIGS